MRIENEKLLRSQGRRAKQGKVLSAVLWVNLVMFFLEFGFGIISGSSALLADSLDMLGDAAVYAFSLYVLARSLLVRARATLLKGFIMLASGVGVSFEVMRRALEGGLPGAETMGIIGGMALLANAFCAYLLFSHRDDDSNLRSTWLCSRNDVIANLSVIVASLLVGYTNSKWPDIFVGSLIALLFLTSSLSVFRDAVADMKVSREERHGT